MSASSAECRLRGLLLTVVLSVTALLAAGLLLLVPRSAVADDWDGDQVIHSDRHKDKEAEEDSDSSGADDERSAYEDAADPDGAKAKADKKKAKAKNKAKGKNSKSKDSGEDEAAENQRGSSYLGLGDEESGVPDGGRVRYVEGQGYVRDDGATEVSRERAATREAADPEQAEAEQVWGPLWGVPADSPVMQGYRADHPMTPEEEEALRTGNKPGRDAAGQPLLQEGDNTEVVYGDEEALTPKERKALAKQRKAEEKRRLKEEREAEREAQREAEKQAEYERLSGRKDTSADAEADDNSDEESETESESSSKNKHRSKPSDPGDW